MEVHFSKAKEQGKEDLVSLDFAADKDKPFVIFAEEENPTSKKIVQADRIMISKSAWNQIQEQAKAKIG